MARRLLPALAALLLAAVPAAADPQSMEQAHQDGTQTARSGAATASTIADQPVTADNIPGYQGTPANLGGLMGSNDRALMSAASGAASVDAYSVMRGADANRSLIDPNGLADIRARADEINADPGAVAGIGSSGTNSVGGQASTCQKVNSQATAATYEATCNVGAKVTTSGTVTQYRCPDGYTLAGATCTRTLTQAASVAYSCPAGQSLAGSTCTAASAAAVSYSCPSGFTLSGTTCTQSFSQAANVSYSCPAGQSLAGTACTATSSATATTSCPAGFTLSGSSCTRALSQGANVTYSCPAGQSLSGTTCSATTAASVSSYSCPAGFSLSGSACSQTTTQPATISGYVCPTDYLASGNTCQKTYTQSSTSVTSCPDGWTLSGTTCTSSSNYAATQTTSCPTGWTLEGTTCSQFQSIGVTTTLKCMGQSYWQYEDGRYSGRPGFYCILRKPTGGCTSPNQGMILDHESMITGGQAFNYCMYKQAATYSCPTGYTQSGNTCTRTATQGVTTTYQCPSGGTLQGTQCFIENATAATITQTCPTGFTLSGSTCSSTISEGATTVYTCPPGYDKASSTCSLTTSQPANPNYSCPAGQTLSGSTCTATSGAIANYSCPAGYGLSDTTCTQTDTQGAATSYSCGAGQTLVGSQCQSTSAAAPNYSCPTGYSLSGTTCSQSNSQAATANYACSAGQTLSGTQCTATSVVTATYSCPSGYALSGGQCSLTQTQPADASQGCDPGSILADGSCATVSEGQSNCQDLAANPTCAWVRDDCLDDPQSGPCKVTERVYRCAVPNAQGVTTDSYVCSGDIYCVNGTCETVERQSSDELKNALVAMGGMDQVQKDFDPNSVALFKGNHEECHSPVFGTINCCAGKVSGLLTGGAAVAAKLALATGPAAVAAVATQFLTMFLCSTSEKMLDVKDRMGLCHFVGTWCSDKFLGICTTKRKTYCCFQSKLTRILQEQGRRQIGKPWGTAKTATCDGFTPDEFARLDLSQMDFSEIYADVLEAAKLPDEAQMASDIQTKIQTYYQQNASGAH